MSEDKETPMNSQELAMVVFDANDRCDGCGAQAYHKAVRTSSSQELLFCNHHHNASEDNLLNAGWQIISHQEAIDKLVMAPG